jgi:hypothetical protein
MLRRMPIACVLVLLCISPAFAEDANSIESLLARPILKADTPLKEVRKFTASRIPIVQTPATAETWTRTADQIRQDMFDRVVFRGEAARWRATKGKVEWLETIEGGPEYKIRKLRYEALPGLWIPALLYVPNNLDGKVPVVMNVNGHDRPMGKAAEYKQIRCINQAKRGMIVLNPEWLGMGQLGSDEFGHYRMNQLDLCGTSGLAPFYLAMERGLDVLLSLEHADPSRVAVAGLSGGGWQTIFISSLDPRVTLANPVAGYSSFLTRVYEPSDLGDSEQTPCDMATVADYCHLTALRAPRPTLLTNNAKDNCCFAADDALPPLIEAAGPIFQLYGKRANLRTHVNYLPGNHNFGLDNRLQLYRMLGEHFYPGDVDYAWEEFSSEAEVKSKAVLDVDLPAGNMSFSSLARMLAANLPRDHSLPKTKDQIEPWQAAGRKRLVSIVKAKYDDLVATQSGEQAFEGGSTTFWKLRLGDTWTVPAVELVRGEPTSTVLLLADGGRKSAAVQVEKLLATGHRVIAIDPFYFGESSISKRDFLYALLVSTVGERMLGIDASQIAAISRWAAATHGSPVEVHAIGPRTSLQALVAASLEMNAISKLNLTDSFGSLQQVLEQDLSVNKTPGLFCFGLLEYFDIKQLVALAAPRHVKFTTPSDRAQSELAELENFYSLVGVKFNPLQ